MPTENVVRLVEETKTLLEEVEAGNPDRAAWIAIQDRVRRICEALSSRLEASKRLGKSPSEISDEAGARSPLRDPEKRKAVLEGLSDAEIRDLAVEASRRLSIEEREDLIYQRTREEIEEVEHLARCKTEVEHLARCKTEVALDALSLRIRCYGDVPISRFESQKFPLIVQLGEIGLGRTDLDEELREILESGEPDA